MAVPKSKRSKAICKHRRTLQITNKISKNNNSKFLLQKCLNQKILNSKSFQYFNKKKLFSKKQNLYSTIS